MLNRAKTPTVLKNRIRLCRLVKPLHCSETRLRRLYNVVGSREDEGGPGFSKCGAIDWPIANRLEMVIREEKRRSSSKIAVDVTLKVWRLVAFLLLFGWLWRFLNIQY